MQVLLAVAAVVGCTALLWGVGALLEGGKDRQLPSITSIGVGLSVLIFAGGLINLFKAAYAPALWLLLAAAAVCLLFAGWRIKFAALPGEANLELILAAIVVAAVTALNAYVQINPAIFNWYDDHEKYFAYPVRMLATGTLAGSPLDSLGSQTLGALPFLQGFVLSVFPIGYINWVDAILGLFILMLIIASAAWRRWAPLPGAAIAAALVTVINPQYVNVSPLFLPAALMATAVLLVAETSPASALGAIRLGLLYAALICLKPLYVVFVVIHCALVCAVAWIRSGWLLGAVREGGFLAISTSIALSPWILVHAGNFLATGTLDNTPAPAGYGGQLDLISRDHLNYGNCFADFTVLASLGAAIPIIFLLIVHRRKDAAGPWLDAQVIAGLTGLASYLVVINAGPFLNGYYPGLRYSIPFLLGCSVLAIAMGPMAATTAQRIASHVLWLPGAAVILVLFVPTTIERYTTGMRLGTMLSFVQFGAIGQAMAARPDQTQQFTVHLSELRSPSTERRIRELQSKVPEGSPLLAWINVPFHLDYRRNQIIDVDTSGLATPWARIPANVRYVLWQREGAGVRSAQQYQADMRQLGRYERLMAARSLKLYNYLQDEAEKSRIVASDPPFVLFELPTRGESSSTR
jgi:hypothetical protein